MDHALIPRLGVALAIGLLVGLERGWRERDEPSGSRTAGLRTFGIFGLLGGILAAVAQAMAAPVVLAAGFLGFAGVFGWFQFHESRDDRTYSVTGVMAGLGVFALGALAVTGDQVVAAAAGAALAAILASREVLHGLLRRLTWVELRSALVLAVMTAIILPLLPDRAVDPWGGLNPWEIWFFTVLTAAISYAGYIAMRVLGPARGLLVSGLAGALVSSTAVTVAFARLTRTGGDARALAGAAALAAMVSVLRVTVIVGLLGPALLPLVAPAALAAAAVFGGSGALLLARAAAQAPTDQTLRNPFELRALMVFAGFFAVAATASAAAVAQFGGATLIATTGASGTFDVDAAVLGALRLSAGAVTAETVAWSILAALATNAAGRLALAVLAGARAFSVPLVLASAAAGLAGGAVARMVLAG